MHIHTHIQHDPPGPCSPGGSEGNYIMFASATDGSLPNNRQFSQCSRESMGQTIDVRGTCFIPSELRMHHIDILNSRTFLNSAMLGYHTQKAMFHTPLSLGSKVMYKSWSNLQVVEARKKLQQLRWVGGGNLSLLQSHCWRQCLEALRTPTKAVIEATKKPHKAWKKKFAHLSRRALTVT